MVVLVDHSGQLLTATTKVWSAVCIPEPGDDDLPTDNCPLLKAVWVGDWISWPDRRFQHLIVHGMYENW